jgi:hypothetical protein
VSIQAGPVWMDAIDDRVFTVSLSMIRLAPVE